MSEELGFERQRPSAPGAKPTKPLPYTTKDFQLEVLGQLAEVQSETAALRDTLQSELKACTKENEAGRLLRFDGRTLVAVGAIALSITGYVLQDARNTSKRDAEIETLKMRVARLEDSSAANTESRVRTEVQLGELRDGQAEIQRMMEAHMNAGKKPASPKK